MDSGEIYEFFSKQVEDYYGPDHETYKDFCSLRDFSIPLGEVGLDYLDIIFAVIEMEEEFGMSFEGMYRSELDLPKYSINDFARQQQIFEFMKGEVREIYGEEHDIFKGFQNYNCSKPLRDAGLSYIDVVLSVEKMEGEMGVNLEEMCKSDIILPNYSINRMAGYLAKQSRKKLARQLAPAA